MAGNIPKYGPFDMLRCLWLIDKRGEQMSRADLMQRLVLGEGTVKSMLALLKEKTFVESSQQGHRLSAAGERYLAGLDALFARPRKVENDAIEAGVVSIATCVAKPDTSAQLDYSLRDEAVKAGANGALFYQFVNDHFEMPGMGRDDKVISTTTKMLKAFPECKPKDGCVLLVSFAKEERNALWGLLGMTAKISGTNGNVNQLAGILK